MRLWTYSSVLSHTSFGGLSELNPIVPESHENLLCWQWAFCVHDWNVGRVPQFEECHEILSHTSYIIQILLSPTSFYLTMVRCRWVIAFDHTQGHTTVDSTPLDEGSARRRDYIIQIWVIIYSDTKVTKIRGAIFSNFTVCSPVF